MKTRNIPEPAEPADPHGWYALAADSSAGTAILPAPGGWKIAGDGIVFRTLSEAARAAGSRMQGAWRLMHRGVEVFEAAT